MKKTLNTSVLESQLAGSVFFRKDKSADTPEGQNASKENRSDVENFFKGKSVFFPEPEAAASVPSPKVQSTKKKSKSMSPRNQDTTVSSDHETMQPRYHGIKQPLIETVRKAVKQIGKEAATHRFTEEEKRAIAHIVYTYERQRYRTSENEITRIAVNWLLLDYAEQGKNSVLARLLDALHE